MSRVLIFKLLITFLVSCMLTTASYALEGDDAKELVREAIQVAKELRASESYYDQYAGAGILVDIGDETASVGYELTFIKFQNLGHVYFFLPSNNF